MTHPKKILFGLAIWTVMVTGLSVSAANHPAPSPMYCKLPTHLLPADKADTTPPPAHDRGYDVLRYDMDIQLDPVAQTIDGTLALELAALDAPLSRVLLDLVHDLTCTSINRDGQPQIFTHTDDSLVVELTTPLAAGQSVTLDLAWNGRPPRHGNYYAGLLYRYHDSGTPADPSDDEPIIASLSEPWSSHAWWPCKDHPADKALSTTAITVPDDLIAVSNGTLLGITDPQPGWRRYEWQEAYPISTYLISVAVSNYDSWHEDCYVSVADPPGQPIALDFYVFPNDREIAASDWAVTCDMMEFMVNLAGAYPFPNEKYATAEIKWVGGMENQTVTSISQFLITGDGKYEGIIIHELAHHWFGDSLTPAVWSDIWLNEGFARYAEGLWIEHAYGLEDYRQFMLKIGLLGPYSPYFEGDGVLIDPSPVLPNYLVYDKGAWLLHSLRMLIGDEAFFDCIADYASHPDLFHGSVRVADFISVAEDHAGRDLSGFFTPWLETDQQPQLEVHYRNRPGDNGVDVDVTVYQLQDALFEVAVPIALHSPNSIYDRTLHLQDRRQVFTLSIPAPVDSIVVDPDSLTMVRATPVPPPPLFVDGPWPNPVGGSGGSIRLYLTQDVPSVTTTLYDVRGGKLAHWALGPMAATGHRDDPEALPHEWALPLDSSAGAPLASGVYWLEIKTHDSRSIKKFSLVR